MRLLSHKLLNIMKVLRSKAEKNVGIMLLTIKKSVLNYVLHVTPFPTCFLFLGALKPRALRAYMPYLPFPLTYLHFLRALCAFIFYLLYVHLFC